MTSATRQTKIRKPLAATTATRTLALDAGNYDLKFWDGEAHPKAIRSVRFQLPQGRDAVRYTDASPLIELPDGTRYHFGAQAYKYRRQQQTVIENKVELSRLHLYACMEPWEGATEFALDVYASTPEPAKNEDAIRQQLLGMHEFKRNDQEYRVLVERVEVEREGMGAYHYAQRLGLIPDTGYTIVVDIGGGTWLTRLVDAEGDVIDENVMDRGGAYELATSISFDRRLTNALGTTADPSLIMDGFRTGHIYADTELTWQPWLEEHLDSWFKGIFQTIKAQYTPYMARVTRFLVTGGSSHLISERLAGAQTLCRDDRPSICQCTWFISCCEWSTAMYDNKVRLSQDVLDKASLIASEWGLKNARAAVEAVFRKYADEYLDGSGRTPQWATHQAMSVGIFAPADRSPDRCEALNELDDLLGL